MSTKSTDARLLSPPSQEDLRTRAVAAVEGGRSQTEVAAAFGVSRRSVNSWVKAHRHGGLNALASTPRGRKPGQKRLLTPDQEEQIVQTVLDKHPDEVGLSGFLWTRALVGQLMRKRFGVELTVKGVGKYPKRWGFSWQKPLRRAYEQDPEAIRAWRTTTYPAIAKQARREDGIVLWADQMGLRADHVSGRTWGKAGLTPVVRTTGQRFGLSVMSAISNKGQLYFTVYTGRMDATFCCDFLDRLHRSIGRKVHLIVDQHPAHKAAFTREWVGERPKQIELHFLPGYAPDLNPVGVLNADLKREVLGGTRSADFDGLNLGVRSTLHRLQKLPGTTAVVE
jgi:transposase